MSKKAIQKRAPRSVVRVKLRDDSMDSRIRISSSFVSSIPNVVLTKEEREEVESTTAQVKSLKMKKASYFVGFQTAED